MTYCPEGGCDEQDCPECRYWAGWRGWMAVLVGAAVLLAPFAAAVGLAALAG